MSLRVSDESPVFKKARVVPLANQSKYEKALEKLVAEDFIEKVEHDSECASPTVERCYSLLSRVGQIIWNQCSNLATAKGLTSLMKMVLSCGTRELLYQSHYRPFCWPICMQNIWVWLK